MQEQRYARLFRCIATGREEMNGQMNVEMISMLGIPEQS